jgi:hypothetical protein
LEYWNSPYTQEGLSLLIREEVTRKKNQPDRDVLNLGLDFLFVFKRKTTPAMFVRQQLTPGKTTSGGDGDGCVGGGDDGDDDDNGDIKMVMTLLTTKMVMVMAVMGIVVLVVVMMVMMMMVMGKMIVFSFTPPEY